MPNKLPISADPGPVRNLQCHYIISRRKPLVCEWSEPEWPNGRIQYYIVNLKHNMESIKYKELKKTRWQPRLHLINQSDLYSVSVSTMTYAEGPAVSTLVDYSSPRTLSLVFILTHQSLIFSNL